MSHSYTVRGSRRYRYHVCHRAQKRGWQNCPSPSVPAGEIERFVIEQIQAVGRDPAVIRETLIQARRQAEVQRDCLTAERAGLWARLRDDHADLVQRRRFPAQLLDLLNQEEDSPLRGLIATPTTPTGLIKDNSILKILENSLSDGVLYLPSLEPRGRHFGSEWLGQVCHTQLPPADRALSADRGAAQARLGGELPPVRFSRRRHGWVSQFPHNDDGSEPASSCSTSVSNTAAAVSFPQSSRSQEVHNLGGGLRFGARHGDACLAAGPFFEPMTAAGRWRAGGPGSSGTLSVVAREIRVPPAMAGPAMSRRRDGKTTAQRRGSASPLSPLDLENCICDAETVLLQLQPLKNCCQRSFPNWAAQSMHTKNKKW